ncbi:TMEM175 family protein [Kribbella sp. NPDC049227]|uniref:TMEM175 family protein n=1 Tax=Kribbella sp. NPDC049227 TaxID=3364113 RepID=UPI0037233B69
MGERERRVRVPGLRTGRMEAFSDGVFAIAITLLVLEIGVPPGSGDDLVGALADQWPSYLAYFVSFATIGAVWVAHTVITEYLDHANSVLLRLNLLLLMVVSLLPFPTKLLAEYAEERTPERIAATVYGINLLLSLIMVAITWRYAVHAQLVRPDLADEDVKTLTKRLTPTLGLYVAMIVLGLFLPTLAVLGYLVLAVFILLPFGAIRRERHQRTDPGLG